MADFMIPEGETDIQGFRQAFNEAYQEALEQYSGELLEEALIRQIEEESFEEDCQLVKNDKIRIIFTRTKDYDPTDVCSICLEKFGRKQVIAKINCEHLFHKNCITEWGKYKADCPSCRKTIDTKRHIVRVKRKSITDV